MKRKTFIKIIGIIILFLIFMVINMKSSEASSIEELQYIFDMENRTIQFDNLKSSSDYVTGLSITGSSTVEVGSTITLQAIVKGDGVNFDSYGVTWRLGGASGIISKVSEEEGTRTVRPTIKIKGLTTGTVTITATTDGVTYPGNQTITATHKVTVVSANSGGTGDSGGSGDSDKYISVSPKTVSIGIGESAIISVNASDSAQAACSNCNAVNMTSTTNGVRVTGVSAGTATITFYLVSDPSITATATVIVGNGGSSGTTETPTISVTPKNPTIKVGESVTFSVYTQNCTDCTCTCECLDNCSIIDLKSGSGGIVVTGLSAGTATLKFYINSYPSVYTTATVTVTGGTTTDTTVNVTGITLNKSTLTLEEQEEYTLTPTITPSNATNKNINWSSSDNSVATVNSNGKITAIKAGVAVITAATVDGGKIATCTVTVVAKGTAVTGISLNKTSTTLYVDDTEQLIATITPENAINKNITWKSNNTLVAVVNNQGEISAIAPGVARISATTEDGGKTAYCTVTVKAKDALVSSYKYIITDQDILRVLPKTTKQEFLNNITIADGYTAKIHLKDSDTEIRSTDLIKTGMKMDVGNKTYTIIVIGDINADGDCTLIDLSNLKLHVISTKILTDEYFLAGDMDLDNKVSIVDLSIMVRYMIGLFKF